MNFVYSGYLLGGSYYPLTILLIGDHAGDMHHAFSGDRHLEPQRAQIKLQDIGFNPLPVALIISDFIDLERPNELLDLLPVPHWDTVLLHVLHPGRRVLPHAEEVADIEVQAEDRRVQVPEKLQELL